MDRWKGVFLGILAAIGGFADMGGIITSAQAGAEYQYGLLWTLIPGLIGLIVYVDMAGRVAIASGRTVFDVTRSRLGFRLAAFPLGATLLVNVLTLVIELAGMTLALQLASGIGYLVWFPVAALLLVIILWKAGFDLLENGSALFGLAMVVAVVAVIKLAPPWGQVGLQIVHPTIPPARLWPYLFAAIGLLGAYMTPYQFYFYSSGAIEEEWTGKDLLVNRVTSVVGSCFGAIVVFALVVGAALVLYPHHAQVGTLGDAGRPIRQSLGLIGWILFIIGSFAVCTGAGLENALSGAYSLCQYFGWDWGKHGRPRQAPLFHLTYLIMFVLAMILAYTHVDPIQLTLLTMVVAAASLPFSFLPLLIIANDRDFMGEQQNTLAVNIVAVLLLAMLVAVTISTIPLFIITGGSS